MKIFLALFLVFSILALFGNLNAKENKGAELVIQKRYGQKVKGELITVKPKSLLLMDSESGADVSVHINDVSYIKIVKKSDVGFGVVMGILAGAGTGAIIGFAADKSNEFPFGPPDDAKSQVASFAIIGGLVGALGGGLTGALSSRPEKYKIAGQSPEGINSILAYLRSKARVPDYN